MHYSLKVDIGSGLFSSKLLGDVKISLLCRITEKQQAAVSQTTNGGFQSNAVEILVREVSDIISTLGLLCFHRTKQRLISTAWE